ncbi:MAG: hypothetical protein BGO43_03810 [Gammaproteobacteria bacterium 39-13]|nr:hypothetical protein [Gammaproteobacteria bacterium]OJV96520.1 MAG: hypothetical protein BGO43_03810 [Gammaproteobacteria bacterium 39-13]
MTYIEAITEKKALSTQEHIVYVGYDDNELNELLDEHKSRQLSGAYFGEHDSLLRIYTEKGDEYIAVFKAKEDSLFRTSQSFQTLIDKHDRLMLCANGYLYRYLINEKKCISVTDYDCPHMRSADYYGLASSLHQLMILVTVDGVVAVNWEKELWQTPLKWSYAGYLSLEKIDENYVHAEYSAPSQPLEGGQLAIELSNGKIFEKQFNQGRWSLSEFHE